MVEQRRGGGYYPPTIDYSSKVSEQIGKCIVALENSDPSAFSFVEGLHDLLEPYLNEIEKTRVRRIYIPLYDFSGEERIETICDEIDKRYEVLIAETYEAKKSDGDITSDDWNRSMLMGLDRQFGAQAEVEKARILMRILLNTDACKKVTRERQTWLGER